MTSRDTETTQTNPTTNQTTNPTTDQTTNPTETLGTAHGGVHATGRDILWTPEDGVTQSMITTTLACPAKGYWRYWRGLEHTGEKTESIKFGKAIHETCYLLHRGTTPTRDLCLTEYGEELGTIVYNAFLRYKEGVWDKELIRRWKSMEEVIECHHRGWRLRGRIDGYLPPRTLLEIKTTTQPMYYTDFYAYSPQSILYAHLLKQNFQKEDPIYLYLVVIQRCLLRKRSSETLDEYDQRVHQWYLTKPDSVLIHIRAIDTEPLDSLLDLLGYHMRLWEQDMLVRNIDHCHRAGRMTCAYSEICLQNYPIRYRQLKRVHPELDDEIPETPEEEETP